MLLHEFLLGLYERAHLRRPLHVLLRVLISNLLLFEAFHGLDPSPYLLRLLGLILLFFNLLPLREHELPLFLGLASLLLVLLPSLLYQSCTVLDFALLNA